MVVRAAAASEITATANATTIRVFTNAGINATAAKYGDWPNDRPTNPKIEAFIASHAQSSDCVTARYQDTCGSTPKTARPMPYANAITAIATPTARKWRFMRK